MAERKPCARVHTGAEKPSHGAEKLALGAPICPKKPSAHPPAQASLGPLFLRGDKTVHHQFSTRLVEIDGQFGAIDRDHRARSEFVVEHPGAGMEA